LVADLPFQDTADFEDADRGFVGALEPCIVEDAKGAVVWDNDAYAFVQGECPDTANPSLWRQAQLASKQGLYQVTAGIYQVRGLDLSNMTLVEGDTGVVVIDPLISAETAAAALALYRRHRGDRPVTGVVFTHSHVDHFGGVDGVVTDDDVPILAPAGFLEHAVSENVYAGPAMSRRASYMYGSVLEKGPDGQIGCGLGMTTSTGSVGLRAPTVDITATGQTETVDGVRMVFQLTPGTEAPAEMNFLFPDRRALCLAENATHNLHNVLTLRGALVRDPRVWARYLNEAIQLFQDDIDVAFASHHWPTWGKDRIVTFLSQQRDMYAYLHDQTLRMLNSGLTGAEVAEAIELPPALEQAWHVRGYYGSVSHNVKAIYQRYMGWFDAVPAHLWEHPPEATARRWVDCLGGPDAALAKAREYLDDGDVRFAAQLANQVVFAEGDTPNAAARELLAEAYQRLGRGAENGTWRNFYLVGAKELREGPIPVPVSSMSPGMASALTIEQFFDSLAVRINGPKAWSEHFSIDWALTDLRTTYRTTLSNGALIHYADPTGEADATLTLTKPQMLGLLAGAGGSSGNGSTPNLDGIDITGDTGVLEKLVGLVETSDPNFDIVTP
jgi:alkyl sulfatase BDS1-like metallo-beta-lactamase superfamily hydrolase